MNNSSNIKHQTSKFASLAISLFIAIFVVTIQSAKADGGVPVEHYSLNVTVHPGMVKLLL